MDDIRRAPETAEDALRYWLEHGFSPGGEIREVDYSQELKGLDPSLKGIKIVDCDTHFTEPPDLFTSRAPAKYKGMVPHVRRVNGWDRWYIGDADHGAMGGSVIRRDNNKILGRLGYPTIEDCHLGSFQVKPRLQAMDDMGIYAQICYQNSGITQAGSLMALDDKELGYLVLKIYNDAAMEREEEFGQRIFTLGHLPVWDKAEMDREARRCVDMGIKGFVLPDMPERLPGVPSFDDSYFAHLLEICEGSGTSLNFHLNAGIDPSKLSWKSFEFAQSLTVNATMFSIGNAATLGNWMVSGLLDKYPKLKIALIESGMGWVPFAIEGLEHQFDEMLPGGTVSPEKRPWEYFRENFWVTYWFEKVGPQRLLETLGADRVLFETDFPHPTSLYPGVQKHLVDTLGGYDYAVRKQVLQDNAVSLYKLPF